MNNAMGGTQKDQKKDWGLGGLLLLHDQIDGKAAGSMIWGGLPNLTWVSSTTYKTVCSGTDIVSGSTVRPDSAGCTRDK